jgi:hypothetical protein
VSTICSKRGHKHVSFDVGRVSDLNKQKREDDDYDEREQEEKAEGTRTNRFPPCDLFVVPNAGYVGVSSRTRIDKCRLGDGQCSWDAGALLVVF